MSTFLDELKNNAGGITSGALGGIFNIFGNMLTNRSNRKIMEQQNAFNAQQADINRQWQEDMYNKYSSPSAMVRQYQEAGLNPVLAGQYGGQTFSGSTAQSSGNIASVGTGLESIAPAIMSVVKLATDVGVAKSVENLNNADAELKRSQITKTASDIEVNNKNIERMQKEIEDLGNQIKNRDAKTTADVEYIDAQTKRIIELTPKESAELDSRIKELNSKVNLNDEQKSYYAILSAIGELQKTTEQNKAANIAESTISIKYKNFEQDIINKWLYLYGVRPSEYQIKMIQHNLAHIYQVDLPYDNISTEHASKLNFDLNY